LRGKEYLIALDAGTTSIKAVVFDEEGTEVYIASASSNVISDKRGFVELDMELLWKKAARCIRESIEGSRIEKNNIRAVSVCGQGEGCWLLDRNGVPVSNAILWSDNRAADIVQDIKRNKNLYDEIKKTTGSYPRPGATIVLLKWYKENRPNEFNRAAYCVSCKDWLRYKITSELMCEVTDASTSYIDIVSKAFPVDLFGKLGIAGVEAKFPKLLSPSAKGGYVTASAAKETSLPVGLCVSGGMLDIVSTSVGTGAIEIGDICTILGTSCINEMVTDTFVFQENMTGWERHFVDGLFVNVAGAMAGTPNLDWAMINILGKKKFSKQFTAELESTLSKIPVGSNGLIYHPYVSLAGERAPFFNSSATGHISGIKTTTTTNDILRSVYEGVALSSRDCLSGFEIKKRIFLSGGGSRSDFWAQIFADCIGCEVVVGEGEEFCAKGGAISAAIASGMYRTASEAVKKFCRIKKRFEPNEANRKRYDEMYSIYWEMRKQFESFWAWRENFLNVNN